MSAYSDYKATGDESDFATFRQECERDERDYFDKWEKVEFEDCEE